MIGFSGKLWTALTLVLLSVVPVGQRALAAEPDDPQSASFWLDAAARYADQTNMLDPDGRVQHQLVYVLARAGDLPRASVTATKVTNPQLRVYAHTFVAAQYHQRGDNDASKKQLDSARDVALQADREKSSVFINSKIIQAYFEADCATDAEAYVAALREEHQRRIGYQYVAAELAKRGQLDKAFEIVSGQLPANWQDTTLLQMANACATELRLEEFRELVKRLTSAEHRDQAYTHIVGALLRAQRQMEAKEFAARISNADTKAQASAMLADNVTEQDSVESLQAQVGQANTRDEKLALYRKLFEKQVADGKIAEAAATIEDMVKVVDAYPREPEITKFGRSDDSVALAGIRAMYLTTAQALAAAGKRQEGMQHLKKAQSAILDLAAETGLAKALLVNGLVQAQISVGDLDGARRVLPLIGNDHSQSMAAKALAIAYIRELNMPEARETANFITAELGKGSSIGAVAAEFVAANELFLARGLLNTLEDSEEDGQAYRPVARAMIRRGLHTDLLTWLEETSSPVSCAYACMGAAEELQAD